jgi:NAD(P)H-dependent flavin oxidoreductase YrpB (nitropropane dioxygenase family)
MGAAVSNWTLARSVSKEGQLGIVSGTALAQILIRRLQLGDPTGEIKGALEDFPNQEIASKIWDTFFIDGGKNPKDNFKSPYFPIVERTDSDPQLLTLKNKDLEGLIVAANFVEVNLAKKGHNNPVGINYLHKIQWPLLPAIYGAMLAGVDTVLMGAGLPRDIPEVLDDFSNGNSADMGFEVTSNNEFKILFNPREVMENTTELKRPSFGGIVSSHLAARVLPNADFYLVEEDIAGGHNAPARGKETNEKGEPIYGIKDKMDFKKLNWLIKDTNQEFYLAGGCAGKLKKARALGARGIQVGTLFALCKESGMEPNLRRRVINQIMSYTPEQIEEGIAVYTDPRVSPSGYPFKVARIKNTLSSQEVRDKRKRVCNKGYLVEFYEDGKKIKTRCSAEPVHHYLEKGGNLESTLGKGCLCNGLVADVGLGDPEEPQIVTLGSNLRDVRELVKTKGRNYTSRNVIDYVLEGAN